MWKEKDNKLYKEFIFESFSDAIGFINTASKRIEEIKHHPEWKNTFNKVEVWLVSHSENEITDKDRELAKILDGIYDRFDNVSKAEPELRNDSSIHSVKLYTDGGSRGNPGPSAVGFVVLDMDDTQLYKDCKYIGITTNNQAEYQGLKEGLEYCLSKNYHQVHVFMDSLLVVNQLKGVYKVKNRDLWPVYEAVKDLVSHFKSVDFTHVPRELNKIADSMVNESLDQQIKKQK